MKLSRDMTVTASRSQKLQDLSIHSGEPQSPNTGFNQWERVEPFNESHHNKDTREGNATESNMRAIYSPATVNKIGIPLDNRQIFFTLRNFSSNATKVILRDISECGRDMLYP